MRSLRRPPVLHLGSLLASIILLGGLCVPVGLKAQTGEVELPPVSLDVLDDYVWSLSELWMAPGQELHITNRDVERHTFTVDEWNIDENLNSLATVIVTIPIHAKPGDQVTVYSSVFDDRERGLEGSINVVAPEDVLTGIRLIPNLGQIAPSERVRIYAKDDFTFEPALVTVGPGTIIEVVNNGVIEHHFVVDEWGVNQTISPGNMALILVPETAEAGTTVEFYCSMPGHQQQGMVGILRIVGKSSSISTMILTADGRRVVPIDMRPFLPEASSLGPGWGRLRSGSSESILGGDQVNTEVFPYSGVGAVYVGPNGTRVTILVLPLQTEGVPLSQVKDAVGSIQSSLSSRWTIDRVAGAAWQSVGPPYGCTVAQRTSGIVPVVTIASGVTSCQLTGVGVALFVSVEGEYEGYQGVLASDRIVNRIVGGGEAQQGVP